ncbi:heavy metal-binding domain-containing protein, partial [Pseudomonas aeruginosa]
MKTRIWKGALLTGLALAIGAAGGYWFAQPLVEAGASMANAQESSAPDEREVLYWYDPMYPQQKFDQPGKSPFMDMELVPRYAGEASDSAAVSIDPSVVQNLGMRLATVTREHSVTELEVVGNL